MKSSWSIDDQSGFWAWKLWPSGIGLKDKLIRNFSHKTPTLDHQISHCLAVETRACLKTWNDMVTVVWPWSNRTRSFVPACQLQELGRVMEDDSFFYLFWDCNMIVDKSALYSLEKRYLYHGEYRDVFQMYVTLTKIRVAIIDQMLLLSTSVVLVILFSQIKPHPLCCFWLVWIKKHKL